MTFPDSETALMDFLEDIAHGVTSTPPNLVTALPIIRVQRIGGTDDKENDYPRMSVDSFTAAQSQNPRAGHHLANQIRDRLNDDLPAMSALGGVLLDYATTESGPVEYPWPDPAIQVLRAVYTLTVRPI